MRIFKDYIRSHPRRVALAFAAAVVAVIAAGVFQPNLRLDNWPKNWKDLFLDGLVLFLCANLVLYLGYYCHRQYGHLKRLRPPQVIDEYSPPRQW